MHQESRGRPGPGEYNRFYAGYVSQVEGDDPVRALEEHGRLAQALFGSISEERSLYRYAPGKWSIRQIAGHLGDAERVFAYRALRIGRGDPTPLEKFDEDAYVAGADFDAIPLADLARELAALRASTLAMFRGFPAAAWSREGIASTFPISLRALAFIIPGHERHHLGVLKDRYGV